MSGLIAARLVLVARTGVVHFAGATIESELALSLIPLGPLVVGGLIGFRRPLLAIGWWWLVVGLAGACLSFGQSYAAYALVDAPGTVAGGVLVLPSAFVPGVSGMVEGLPRPLGLAGFGWYELVTNGAIVALFLVGAPATLVAQALRYRRARGRERAQMKWFVFGGAIFLASLMAEVTVGVSLTGMTDAVAEGLTFNAPVAAVGIAVLRHRLYDIDRIISRTVAWTGDLLATVAATVQPERVGLWTPATAARSLPRPAPVVAPAEGPLP